MQRGESAVFHACWIHLFQEEFWKKTCSACGLDAAAAEEADAEICATLRGEMTGAAVEMTEKRAHDHEPLRRI